MMLATKNLHRFTPLLTVPLAIAVALTITYTGGFGGAFSVLRLLLGVVVAGLLVALPFVLKSWRGIALSLVLCLVVGGWWASHQPSNDRQWAEPASRTAHATIDGNLVTIHDVRNFRYDEDGTWTADWYDATYDLNEIEQSYFMLTTFGFTGVAHVMVSFRFAGDQYVVLSVEIRREEGEEYDPIGGVFRQYEIFYTAADERDALALRTHVHKDPTWIIPVNAGPEKTGEFFLDMVKAMTDLHHEPQWYNTITNSCSTSLAKHYEHINDVRLPPDYRILLPGFSDELIAELDLLPQEMTVTEAREQFQVSDVATTIDVDENFSQAIRSSR